MSSPRNPCLFEERGFFMSIFFKRYPKYGYYGDNPIFYCTRGKLDLTRIASNSFTEYEISVHILYQFLTCSQSRAFVQNGRRQKNAP